LIAIAVQQHGGIVRERLEQRRIASQSSLLTNYLEVALDLGRDRGKPPHRAFPAVRPQRFPDFGTTDDAAKLMRNSTAMVENRTPTNQSIRSIV